jgi:16S rRNA (uracil1498-N3)-methyltransferase
VAATPAWPPKSLPRLFVRGELGAGETVALDENQANYLANVLRLGRGSELLVFDGQSGEWLATILDAAKKRLTIRIERQTRASESVPDVWLAFAPVKRTRTDWIVEKATELGAARLVPVLTQRTIVERVRLDRFGAIAIEAAEQCGRTRLPDICEAISLRGFLQSLDRRRHFYFADENGGEALASTLKAGPAVLLVGPEGGFSEEERLSIRGAGAASVSLGPRILRTETAAVAMLSTYMALSGDWR